MSAINQLSPISMLRRIWVYRELIIQLVKRDILGRYKGSYLGLLWSFLTPIFMLLIYTFVFSVIFNARWGGDGNDKLLFAFILFCGLNVFTIFAECINRSPLLISSNVNYVKKVVFPLEILPVTIIISSLVNASIGFGILLIGLLLTGKFHVTALLLPLVILPFVLLTLGMCWFISSLGVYVKDIGHALGTIVNGLMFLSPIFYPITAIPKELQILFYINPLTHVVEGARKVVIWGQGPDWVNLFLQFIVGLVIMYIGYVWFQKTREGFADII